MRFLRPELAWWLITSLAILIVARWGLRRQYAASTTVRWLNVSGFRASLPRYLPTAFLFAALVLTGMAWMNPVVRIPESQVEARSRDIVMLLDMSESMSQTIDSGTGANVQQTSLTRLDAVKNAMRTFVIQRREDRLALVIFSNHAYVICPLTFDHNYLLDYIDKVDLHTISGEGRTAIGDALLTANILLKLQSNTADRRNQLVMLFTDGESDEGSDPVEALTLLNSENIRVNMIGIEIDPNTNNTRVQAVLEAMHKYNGLTFDATTAGDIDEASRTVDALEKGLVIMKIKATDRPVYEWFALPALLCLVGAIVLCAIPFFVNQT